MAFGTDARVGVNDLELVLETDYGKQWMRGAIEGRRSVRTKEGNED